MPEIIPVMKKLGYSPKEKGVCFGIAVMGAQAVIREDPDSFYNRITRIHNLTSETIESIFKEKVLGKTDDLFYFFDEVSIYQGLSAITEDVKKASNCAAPRQSIDNKLVFKNYNDSIESKDDQNKEFNLVDIKEQFICSVTIKELSQFILKLKSVLRNKPFSLMMHHSDAFHTVQLGFSNNHWLVVDHDNVRIYEDNNVDIGEIIKGILPELKQEQENKFNLQIDILLSEQTDIDLSWVKKYELSSSQIIKLKKDKKSLANLINSCAFANQHQMLKKIFQHVDITSIANEMINQKLPITMLLAEASDSHIETTNVLFEVIKKSKLSMRERVDLLRGRCENEVDALYMATYRGYIKTVKAFLRAIEETKLPDELRMSLLKANDSRNRSVLYVAAYKGHTEIVKELLESIEKARFDKIKLLSLLEGKSADGFSALYVAVQEAHIDIIFVLVQAIDNSGFSDEEKVTLLENRNSEGVPILFVAFTKNKIETVKCLFEYILSSNITVDKKIELLQANVPSFNTCLYIFAKECGNEDFVKYLEDTIANASQFTEMQKKQFFEYSE